MIIEEKDFRLTPSQPNASDCWDLELMVTIKPKKEDGNIRREFKNVGYGLCLTSVIKRIATYRVIHKYPGETIISLKTFLTNYLKEILELKSLLLDNISTTTD